MLGTAFPRRGFLSDWAAYLIKARQIRGDVPLWFGLDAVSISPGVPQGVGLEVLIRQAVLPGRRLFPTAAMCSHSVEQSSASDSCLCSVKLGPPG